MTMCFLLKPCFNCFWVVNNANYDVIICNWFITEYLDAGEYFKRRLNGIQKIKYLKQQFYGFSKLISEVIEKIIFYKSQLFVTLITICEINTFNTAKQLYWNHASAWVFSCKFVAYFQNTFH